MMRDILIVQGLYNQIAFNLEATLPFVQELM